MQKTDERTLREIERLFKQYEAELRTSDLSGRSKRNYREAAHYFVRWIRGDYNPGRGPWQ
ncbi:MAG: hypothetical protein OXD46_02100 [Chloroflexi bacterium]|nr:hypothetical protein [Chloroflexota bacterium]